MLECREISKFFFAGGQKIEALKKVSFTVRDGEYVAITGGSGSGKSTLLNILGCLDRQSDGSLLINRKSTDALGEKELTKIRAREIGFVFQSFNLLPALTALENIELPLLYCGADAGQRRKRAMNLLCAVGMESRAAHFPLQLSGGQQQRVAIARALSCNPPLILADEPTGNLDRDSAGAVTALLRELNRKGKTIVLVTHDVSLASQADSRINMIDGEAII